jgi:hypothetical protein
MVELDKDRSYAEGNSMGKPSLGRVLLVVPLGVLSAACVNPENDYNAFISRAKGAMEDAAPAVDAPPADAPSQAQLDAAFSDNKWVMACVSQLAPTVPNAVLSVVNLDFTPGAAGGGTLQFSASALAYGSTNVNSPLAGSAVGPFMATIASNGTGTIMIGDQTIPAAANGVTMSQLILTGVELAFHIESPTEMCASLSGMLTSPLMVALTPAMNPCIFGSTDASGAFTPFMMSQAHCP